MKRRSFLQSIFGLGALAVAPSLSAAPAAPIVQIVRNGIGDYTIHYTHVPESLPESPDIFAVEVEYTGNGTYIPLICNPQFIKLS